MIRILDCTLRDGGYINNWEFSDDNIVRIINSLVESKIDIIECGFLSIKKGLQNNSTQFNSIERVDKILSENIQNHSTSMFVVMVNLGEFDFNDLPEYISGKSIVSGIRLAFHKKDIDEAVKTSEIIIKKGYNLFVQPMITLSYSDNELLELINTCNKLKPYSVYIVDSFGSMSKEDFKRLYLLFNHNLNNDIYLGFHSHNNMQLSYSISIDFIKMVKRREIIIDSSIFGMGRGAGNLNTEVLANYLNEENEQTYMITPMLEIIDGQLEAIYRENFWGFSVAHFLSATLKCHPNYSSYLLNKKNLSIVSIRELLTRIPFENKGSFNENLLEKIYLKYKSEIKIKENISKEFFKNKKIMILASGRSVLSKIDKINDIAKNNDLTVVAVNHISSLINSQYYYFSNQKRYNEFVQKLDVSKLIVTSNIVLHSKHKNCLVSDYNKLVNMDLKKNDNVTVLLLNLLILFNVKNVYIAGFDGYNVHSNTNYNYEEFGRVLDKKQLLIQNDKNNLSLNSISEKIDLNFITPSLFENTKKLKIIGVIPARYKSSRFEGKPLALIKGIPMIQRTYNQAKKSKSLNELIIATDDKRIYDFCTKNKMPVIMTSEKCMTGTDRIAEVARYKDYDFYINIQGDEPVISPETIDQIIESYKKFGDEYIAYNLFKKIDDKNDIKSNTIIKVIVNEQDELMYMSRNIVPYTKEVMNVNYYKQVCVYGFTKEALSVFSSLKQKSKNEKYEDIEILRFLDIGKKVKMIETKYDSISVDIPEDIKQVENLIK